LLSELLLFLRHITGESSYLPGAGGAPVFAPSTGGAGVVAAPGALVFDAGGNSPGIVGAGDAAGDACGVAAGCVSSSSNVSNTERWPVSAGSESAMAVSMKTAAAPIVILASRVCVPRGPKAVLEMPLEKSAPASALPGCKSTETISTTHEIIKITNKTVVN
jgi:hypothetical protein